MVLQQVKVRLAIRRRGPQDIVVVREQGEQDSQEETCRYGKVSTCVMKRRNKGEYARPTIKNVAKEPPFDILMGMGCML